MVVMAMTETLGDVVTIKGVATKLVMEFGEAEEANKNVFKGNNLGTKKIWQNLQFQFLQTCNNNPICYLGNSLEFGRVKDAADAPHLWFILSYSEEEDQKNKSYYWDLNIWLWNVSRVTWYVGESISKSAFVAINMEHRMLTCNIRGFELTRQLKVAVKWAVTMVLDWNGTSILSKNGKYFIPNNWLYVVLRKEYKKIYIIRL